MINPSSKMVVEIRIDESLCDTDRDERLTKETVCYQLGKRLNRKLDPNVMTVVMRVFRGMKQKTVINIYNFQDLRLYKQGAEEIKKIIRSELESCLSNTSKFIADNKADDSEAGGVLYKLLRQKGAALENTDGENSTRYEQEAVVDYKEKVRRYEAFRMTVNLSKKLKEGYAAYSLVLIDDRNPFKPDCYIQLMRYEKPLLWLRLDVTEDQVNSIILFIEGFAGLSYINTINGAKRKVCELFDAEEYLDGLEYQSTYIEDNIQYNDWANPKLLDFLEQLQGEDDAEYEEGTVAFYADSAWISNLRSAAQEVFQEEKDRARMVVVNKILVT